MRPILSSRIQRFFRPLVVVPVFILLGSIYLTFALEPYLNPASAWDKIAQSIDETKEQLRSAYETSVSPPEKITTTHVYQISPLADGVVTLAVGRESPTKPPTVSIVSQRISLDYGSFISILALITILCFLYGSLYRDFSSGDELTSTEKHRRREIDYDHPDPHLVRASAEDVLLFQIRDAKKRSTEIYNRAMQLLGSGIIMSFAGIAIFYFTSPTLDDLRPKSYDWESSAKLPVIWSRMLGLEVTTSNSDRPPYLSITNPPLKDLVATNPGLVDSALKFNLSIYKERNKASEASNPLQTYAYRVVRPVGMLLFIEGIAWFLLRQYRSLLQEHKKFYAIYLQKANQMACIRAIDKEVLRGDSYQLALLVSFLQLDLIQDSFLRTEDGGDDQSIANILKTMITSAADSAKSIASRKTE
jgi:hypothetical protein